MADIIDIIQRLSFEVVGSENLKSTVDTFQKQIQVIDNLKSKLSDLNKQYKTEDNVKAQQNLSGQIDKTTDAISRQTKALTQNFNSNKQIQQALSDEIGLVQQLTEYIAQATKERATLTNSAEIKKYTEDIKTAQNELKALLQPISFIGDKPQAGLLQALQQRQKILSGTIPTLTTKDEIGIASKELDRVKIQIKELQGIGKEPIISIRQTGAIEALNSKLTILKNTLKTLPKEEIAAVNQQIIRTEAELKSLQGLGKDTEGGILGTLLGGNGGSLGKQLLTGGLIAAGFGSGIGLITRAVSGLIEYAQAELDVIGKAEKLQSANEALAKSFDDVGDAIDSVIQKSSKLNLAALGDDQTEEGLKRKAELLKAVGVVNKEVFNQEQAQLNADQLVRQKELEQLQDKRNALQGIADILEASKTSGQAFVDRPDIIALSAGGNPQKNKNVQFELFKQLINSVNSSNIPDDIKTKIQLDLNKAYQDGANLLTVLNKETAEYKTKLLTVNESIKDNANATELANQKLQTTLRLETESKSLELQKEVEQQQETFRQLKEKKDIASVDKIVSDTKAKYDILARDLRKQADEEAKKFPNFVKGSIDNLPKPILSRYNQLFGLFKLQQNADTNNQTEALREQQSLISVANRAKESAGAATNAKVAASFGLPDYDRLVEVLDKETKAKKDALDVEFTNAKYAYAKNGDDITTLQKQYEEKQVLIDQQAYSDRLALAMTYYQQLAKIIKDTSAVIATEIDTAILNRGGSDRIIDRRRRRAVANGRIQDANNLLPAANDALNRANDAATNANGEEATKAAAEEALKQKAIVEGLNNDIAKSNKELKDITKQETLEKIDLFQSFVSETVKGYSVIAEARQKDLEREISVRTQRVDLAYKLAERGNTQALAAEQKALDQANAQKRKAALQEQAINAALTVSNSILAVAKAAVEGGPFAPLTIAAAISAIGVGFAEAYALNASSKQGFYKGGYTGDGGKYDEAGTVHKGEFVIDKEKTARYRPLLEAIHRGGMPQLARAEFMPHAEGYASKRELQELSKKIDNVVEAINGKTIDMHQSVDKNGVFQMVKEQQSAHVKLWSR